LGDYYKKYPEKVKELNRKYREANREQCLQWSRESYHRRKADPSKIASTLYKNAKSRAAKKGIEFSISIEDIIVPEVCPVFKVPFDKSTRKYSYSLDRKDPTKGYTKDNVWVISQLANAMKWDSTPEELHAFCVAMLALEGGELA
jgi:hypothetical protein